MEVISNNVVVVDIEESLIDDVVIQVLNIKRDGGITESYFIEETNMMVLKYPVNTNSNIEEVIESWGKIVSNKTENTHVIFDITDLKDSVRKELDKIYQSTDGSITLSIED